MVTIWIVTTKGFISLVVDKDDADVIQVRARIKDDITALFPNALTYVAKGADYRYRARVSRTEVAVVLANEVLDMDYTSHFKDVAIARSSNAESRRSAYYGCWTALAKLQDYAPYSTTSRAEQAKRAGQAKSRGTFATKPPTAGARAAWPGSYDYDPGYSRVAGPSDSRTSYGTGYPTKLDSREDARLPEVWDDDEEAIRNELRDTPLEPDDIDFIVRSMASEGSGKRGRRRRRRRGRGRR